MGRFSSLRLRNGSFQNSPSSVLLGATKSEIPGRLMGVQGIPLVRGGEMRGEGFLGTLKTGWRACLCTTGPLFTLWFSTLSFQRTIAPKEGTTISMRTVVVRSILGTSEPSIRCRGFCLNKKSSFTDVGCENGVGYPVLIGPCLYVFGLGASVSSLNCLQ